MKGMRRCCFGLLVLTACGTDPGAPAPGGTAGSAGSAGSSSSGGAGASSGGSAGQASGGTAGSATGGAGGSNGGSAGSGGTAGSAGSAGGAGTFFGASRCTGEFDLCEDFEGAELDTNRWEIQGDAPTLDAARAARGSKSAHFHTEDNGHSLIRESATFPAANNSYWARIFVYIDALPTAPDWAHWTISGAVGSGTDAEIRVGGQLNSNAGINLFGVGTDGGPTGDWTNLDDDPAGDPVVPPEHEWICVEWQHKGDTDETRFFWDGVEHPSLYTSSSEHGGSGDPYLLPEFESVWFGWWLYQAGTTPGAFDIWIDEIAVDGERIGCEN